MEKEHAAHIKILKNGPIQIKGEFVFRDSTGNVTTEHKELYICRCGNSGNKPFCDCTHEKQ